MDAIENSISITNSSDKLIIIIIEFIAYIQDLEPGEKFTLKASTLPENNILNLFDVDYQVGQVTIFMNNNSIDAYDLSYYINDELILNQRY